MAGKPEFWVRYNPLGCAVTYVSLVECGPMLEDALRWFTPFANDRRKEAVEGWKCVLVDRGKLRNLTGCLQGRCSHGNWP